MRSSLRAAATWFALAAATGGCVIVEGHDSPAPPARAAVHRPGPPPHAPAHGYRHKHHGRDLVFDSAFGVYVVVGLRDVWFLDGHYFRIAGDRWEVAAAVGGPWRVAAAHAVPVRLYEKRHPHGGPPGHAKREKRGH